MHILKIRPAPPGAWSKVIANFDAQITDDLRLYGLQLREFESGVRRTTAPQAYGRHFATFTPALAQQLTDSASLALGALHGDDWGSARTANGKQRKPTAANKITEFVALSYLLHCTAGSPTWR